MYGGRAGLVSGIIRNLVPLNQSGQIGAVTDDRTSPNFVIYFEK
jgi:hypothetical protein